MSSTMAQDIYSSVRNKPGCRPFPFAGSQPDTLSALQPDFGSRFSMHQVFGSGDRLSVLGSCRSMSPDHVTGADGADDCDDDDGDDDEDDDDDDDDDDEC